MAEIKVTLKLLIDTKAKKVLFAEAGKPFVDFLFHIMSLSVGTIVKLLNVKNMAGSLGSIYGSIESLNTDYFQSFLSKDVLLKPKSPVNVPLLSLGNCDAPAADTVNTVYKCGTSHCIYVTDCMGALCPTCKIGMSTAVRWVRSPSSSVNVASTNSGFVQGIVTYMVMDNLEVKPMSTISGITLMTKFQVKDVSTLVEKEVQVGLKEAIAMLKASLETKAVLTTVFVGK